ncbi:MAG: phage shock protein A [Desulfobacterales bacterium]|nr:MAG: phage shock protein A [Desulfobacterales bacterium]
MLDRAEDPEKMIKLMIHEMEDTLIELKSSCAGVIAGTKKLERKTADFAGKVALWGERAALAVSRGKDDLAREALIEKRRHSEILDALKAEIEEHKAIRLQYREDIEELEKKLTSAKEKKRVLVERHKRAIGKKRAQQDIRRSDSSSTMARFEQLESRIERMEAEAELVNIRRTPTQEEAFAEMATDADIESELAEIKAAQQAEKRVKEDA